MEVGVAYRIPTSWGLYSNPGALTRRGFQYFATRLTSLKDT